MSVASIYLGPTLKRPAWEAIEVYTRRLSLLDWARLCRIRSLRSIQAPWQITDAEGLMITYAWSLHNLRHVLNHPDPLDWLLMVPDLARLHEVCLVSWSTEDGWQLGERAVTTAGAIRLLARFGEGRPWWEDCWSCEDCRCRLCDAPVEYPFSTCLNTQACVQRIRQRHADAQRSYDEDDDRW